MKRTVFEFGNYDGMIMLIIICLVISICAMIVLIAIGTSDDSSSAINQEMHNCIKSRYEGGSGIGFGVDAMSGKMKIGYGAGPINIVSF